MCSVAGQCDTSRTGAPLYKTKRNAPDWAGNVDADAKGEGVESRTAIDREARRITEQTRERQQKSNR